MTGLRCRPKELMDGHIHRMRGVNAEDFFVRPEYQKEQDIWLAAHFGIGYEAAVGPCEIEMTPDDDRDFLLVVGDVEHPFQATEAMQPDRRRGDEFRRKARDRSSGPEVEDWEPGTKYGPDWVKAALERKHQKRYSTADSLNLLIYANFPGWELSYESVRGSCESVSHKFRSIWIVTGNAVCAVKPHDVLKGPEEWKVIPSVQNLHLAEVDEPGAGQDGENAT